MSDRDHSIYSLLSEVLDQLETSYGTEFLDYVPISFAGWGSLTIGLRRGKVHILHGPPRSGLTSFGLTIARNAALRYNQPTVFLSEELTASDLGKRCVAAQAEVPLWRIEMSTASTTEWESIAAAFGNLARAPLRLCQSPPNGNLDPFLEPFPDGPPMLLVLDGEIHPEPEALSALATARNMAILVLMPQNNLAEPNHLARFDSIAQSVAHLEPAAFTEAGKVDACITITKNKIGHIGKFSVEFVEELLIWCDILDLNDPPSFGPPSTSTRSQRRA